MFIAETFALFKTFFKFVVRFPKKKYSVNITVKKLLILLHTKQELLSLSRYLMTDEFSMPF